MFLKQLEFHLKAFFHAIIKNPWQTHGKMLKIKNKLFLSRYVPYIPAQLINTQLFKLHLKAIIGVEFFLLFFPSSLLSKKKRFYLNKVSSLSSRLVHLKFN